MEDNIGIEKVRACFLQFICILNLMEDPLVHKLLLFVVQKRFQALAAFKGLVLLIVFRIDEFQQTCVFCLAFDIKRIASYSICSGEQL